MNDSCLWKPTKAATTRLQSAWKLRVMVTKITAPDRIKQDSVQEHQHHTTDNRTGCRRGNESKRRSVMFVQWIWNTKNMANDKWFKLFFFQHFIFPELQKKVTLWNTKKVGIQNQHKHSHRLNFGDKTVDSWTPVERKLLGRNEIETYATESTSRKW